MNFDKFTDRLRETGLGIWPDFLSPQQLAEVRTDLDHIEGAGGFKRAGTGQGAGKEVRDEVRRDQIHWLERVEANPVQKGLWSRLDSLQEALNRTLYLGLLDFEGHYAVYPEGGFYKRHLDCFQHDDSRMVSLIIYLNYGWKPADGGQLRVYQGESHTDVEPQGGTLVAFMSRELEHEVLSSHAPRYSFTGWFKRKPSLQ